MKLTIPSLIALLVLPASLVMAQGKVVALSPSDRASLDLYEQPGSAQPVRQISVSEASLPLAIQATQTNYYKVAIAGHDYWLRANQVRITRNLTAGCTITATAPTVATIATPGAGKDACQ